MKPLIVLAVTALLFVSTSDANAKGCIKGAVVGGVAGHYAGHGAVGAAAGCYYGRHRARTNRHGNNRGSRRIPQTRRERCKISGVCGRYADPPPARGLVFRTSPHRSARISVKEKRSTRTN